MKQSQVKPGVRAMLSLGGRRGAVAVTVIRRALLSDMRRCEWVTEDSLGRLRHATSRQLQPMPPATLADMPTDSRRGFNMVPDRDGKRAAFLRIVSSEPGQTIDNGDTVITTTLHRLG